MAYGSVSVGTQVISNQTDIAVGRLGVPVRVYSLTVTSGGTAAVVKLCNGTSTGGTALTQLDGTISKTIIQSWNEGLLFPLGCFADVDANSAIVAIAYSQEN